VVVKGGIIMDKITIQSVEYDKDRSVVDVNCIITKPIDKIVMDVVTTPEDITPKPIAPEVVAPNIIYPSADKIEEKVLKEIEELTE
jgi:hypothetical protein